jgi:hypothetical protein
VAVQMLTWQANTCHSVSTFSGVLWGHFQVTRGKDDVIPHIGDRNCLAKKLKGKCIQRQMQVCDCNKKKGPTDAMFHRLYFIRFSRLGYRSMQCKGLLKVFSSNEGKGPRAIIESLSAQRTKHLVQALDHIKEEAEGGCISKGVKGSRARLFHGVPVLKG